MAASLTVPPAVNWREIAQTTERVQFALGTSLATRDKRTCVDAMLPLIASQGEAGDYSRHLVLQVIVDGGRDLLGIEGLLEAIGGDDAEWSA